LGIEDRVGTIEADKLADLLIVDGRPDADPSVLRDSKNIVAVFKAGVAKAGSLREQLSF
jgi:imidazolonepropionase-like amidohydrolase